MCRLCDAYQPSVLKDALRKVTKINCFRIFLYDPPSHPQYNTIWQQEYEAGIPGNGSEQDVNISLFAIFLCLLPGYNLFIGWFQLYYFHFYCQLSWLDVIQDDLKSALATMENFR